MRRHQALRKLSSDHHSGLVLARRAAAAADEPAGRSQVWREIRRLFEQELEPHFRDEETGLLPALMAAGETELVEKTLQDHRLMRRLIAEDREENLALFAETLRSHIRFEERSLFETAQRNLSAQTLNGLC